MEEQAPSLGSKVQRWALWILVITTLVVFLPVYGHDFVAWDDTHNLAANQRMLEPSWENVKWYWRELEGFKDLYIPVTYTLWAAVASVARVSGAEGVELNPSVFHALNSVLHVVSAIVVFAILKRLFGLVWPALLGALVFAVHPVQVEPVAWVSGLKDVLSGLLALLAVLGYILFAQQRKLLWHAVATGAFILAMLAKPSAVVVPLVVGVIDLVIIKRRLRDAIFAPLVWIAISMPIILVGMIAQKAAAVGFIPPVWARPFVAMDALGFYLLKLVAPLKLAIDYGRSPQYLWDSGQIWVTWVIPVAAAVAIALLVWKWRLLFIAAGFAVMAVALLPVLGLVPFDFQTYSTTADHYLYFPMLGPAIVVAGIAVRWFKRAVVTALVVWISVLGIRSHIQSWVWRDSASLFEHTVATNPTSLAGLLNLGDVYSDEAQNLARSAKTEAARAVHAKAVAIFEKAVAVWPDDFDARARLASLYKEQGRWQDAEKQYREAVRIYPLSSDMHMGVGAMLGKQGKLDDAIRELENAVRLDPQNAIATKMLQQARELREKKAKEAAVGPAAR